MDIAGVYHSTPPRARARDSREALGGSPCPSGAHLWSLGLSSSGCNCRLEEPRPKMRRRGAARAVGWPLQGRGGRCNSTRDWMAAFTELASATGSRKSPTQKTIWHAIRRLIKGVRYCERRIWACRAKERVQFRWEPNDLSHGTLQLQQRPFGRRPLPLPRGAATCRCHFRLRRRSRAEEQAGAEDSIDSPHEHMAAQLERRAIGVQPLRASVRSGWVVEVAGVWR